MTITDLTPDVHGIQGQPSSQCQKSLDLLTILIAPQFCDLISHPNARTSATILGHYLSVFADFSLIPCLSYRYLKRMMFPKRFATYSGAL